MSACGDSHLLVAAVHKHIANQRQAYHDGQRSKDGAVEVITSCLHHVYSVPVSNIPETAGSEHYARQECKCINL